MWPDYTQAYLETEVRVGHGTQSVRMTDIDVAHHRNASHREQTRKPCEGRCGGHRWRAVRQAALLVANTQAPASHVDPHVSAHAYAPHAHIGLIITRADRWRARTQRWRVAHCAVALCSQGRQAVACTANV